MHTSVDIEALNQQIYIESAFVEKLNAETSKVIVGQDHMIERLLLGLLTKGHILLEGLPGLAKTLAIKTLASAIDADFSRIQFTPDLLPADIIGTMIYNPNKNEFNVRKGPVFANFVLADEINRAPAKVQSALLEAMQERQVTIGNDTFNLEEPFLVLATQNPIDQEGTYPLPEAQVDRFMLKVLVDYPNKEEEREIIRRNLQAGGFPKVQQVVSIETILKAREVVKKVYMDEKIEQYILDIVFATRTPEEYGLAKLKPLINFGGSPRASINIALAAKAHAFLQRRGFVIPEDVRSICHDVLRHRIGLTYEAEAENISQVDIINDILNSVEVP
jgi:MoxR-like ATPase